MSTSANIPFNFDVSAWPPLPKMPGLMVVGTGTDVGKTLVAGAIARNFRRQGRRVAVFKPVASGCRGEWGGTLISEDAEFLAACADSEQSLADIAPLCYAMPLAPNVAAEREGRPVDLEEIFSAWGRLAEYGDVVVAEGVGGLLCPISDEFWVIHFAKMVDLPLVVVARPDLGTINHTLLTLHAARGAGLRVAAVVVNRYPAAYQPSDPATETNPAQIAQRGGVDEVVVVPNDPDNSVEGATLGPGTEAIIAAVAWDRLAGL